MLCEGTQSLYKDLQMYSIYIFKFLNYLETKEKTRKEKIC